MEKLIEFIKDELPEHAVEIQGCIELLSQHIEACVGDIKTLISNAIDIRNYEKLDQITTLLQSIDHIQNKLEEYTLALQIDRYEESEVVNNTSDENKELIPAYDELRLDPSIPYTLLDTFTYKRPSGFQIQDKKYYAKEWKEVLIKTCDYFVKKDKVLFESFVWDKMMQGRTISYFSKDPRELRTPREITGTDIFIMSNMSANQVRNIIVKMLRKYNVEMTDFSIYLRADYTPRHKQYDMFEN